jgi:hypothetical protein
MVKADFESINRTVPAGRAGAVSDPSIIDPHTFNSIQWRRTRHTVVAAAGPWRDPLHLRAHASAEWTATRKTEVDRSSWSTTTMSVVASPSLCSEILPLPDGIEVEMRVNDYLPTATYTSRIGQEDVARRSREYYGQKTNFCKGKSCCSRLDSDSAFELSQQCVAWLDPLHVAGGTASRRHAF